VRAAPRRSPQPVMGMAAQRVIHIWGWMFSVSYDRTTRQRNCYNTHRHLQYRLLTHVRSPQPLMDKYGDGCSARSYIYGDRCSARSYDRTTRQRSCHNKPLGTSNSVYALIYIFIWLKQTHRLGHIRGLQLHTPSVDSCEEFACCSTKDNITCTNRNITPDGRAGKGVDAPGRAAR
jgi:hypothetical protein